MDTSYPALKWQLDGTPVQVNSLAEDDPALLDHHPDDLEKGGAAMVTTKFKPSDIIRLLGEGNIPYDPAGTAANRRSLLTNALMNVVQARGLAQPAGADAETLYAILQG